MTSNENELKLEMCWELEQAGLGSRMLHEETKTGGETAEVLRADKKK